MEFSGSCLCGQTQYLIEGDVIAFYHCHCQRCRKLSGTGHATNLRVDSQSICWQAGEEHVRRFKLNTEERFRNDFCSECGSPLPRHFPELGFIVLPAGTLDHEIELKPSDRIFYDSGASWSCLDDELPCHAEYVE